MSLRRHGQHQLFIHLFSVDPNTEILQENDNEVEEIGLVEVDNEINNNMCQSIKTGYQCRILQ